MIHYRVVPDFIVARLARVQPGLKSGQTVVTRGECLEPLCGTDQTSQRSFQRLISA